MQKLSDAVAPDQFERASDPEPKCLEIKRLYVISEVRRLALDDLLVDCTIELAKEVRLIVLKAAEAQFWSRLG